MIKSPQLITNPTEMLKIRKSFSSSIGFIPTMGALHQGHVSLLERSVKENKTTVLSIFVNPTQFNNSDDFEKYPNTLAKDLDVAKAFGVDFVFTPNRENIYPDQYKYKVSESEWSQKFCGAHRPGHFNGVLTVVMKLLNIVSPTRAYFGEKDYQQLQLVRNMVAAFFMNCEIVAMPTVRESDGLAMSSRNVRLNSEDRKLAPHFYQILKSSISTTVASEKLNSLGFKVDYIEDIFNEFQQPIRRLGAVSLGEVRLIDNIEIN
jgi:pantoate--beta-alanine ligase